MLTTMVAANAIIIMPGRVPIIIPQPVHITPPVRPMPAAPAKPAPVPAHPEPVAPATGAGNGGKLPPAPHVNARGYSEPPKKNFPVLPANPSSPMLPLILYPHHVNHAIMPASAASAASSAEK